MTEEVETFNLKVYMRPLSHHSGDKHLRIGVDPYILIEPEPVEEGQPQTFVLDTTGVDKENLVDLLMGVAQALSDLELELS